MPMGRVLRGEPDTPAATPAWRAGRDGL